LLLVCGLGNTGSTYRNTRHNAGYLVLDRYSDRFGRSISKKMAGCLVGEADGVLLAKPDTFMNLSGGPVSALMRKKSIPPDNLIVIHDDLDMELGRIKFKSGGGDGGHKGVRSIAERVGTKEFHRLKIGIGRDEAMPPEEYVLARFRKDEQQVLSETLDRAVDALVAFIEEGAEKAMNLYNR
jgi:PTH1 family peptidyl-tRNA hydrolase